MPAFLSLDLRPALSIRTATPSLRSMFSATMGGTSQGFASPLDQGWEFDSGVAPHLETSHTHTQTLLHPSLRPGCSRAETRLCFCCLFPL